MLASGHGYPVNNGLQPIPYVVGRTIGYQYHSNSRASSSLSYRIQIHTVRINRIYTVPCHTDVNVMRANQGLLLLLLTYILPLITETLMNFSSLHAVVSHSHCSQDGSRTKYASHCTETLKIIVTFRRQLSHIILT